jgi:hypothetical protein
MEKTAHVLRNKSHHLSSQISFAPVIKYLNEKKVRQIYYLQKDNNDLSGNYFSIAELTLPICDLKILKQYDAEIGNIIKAVINDIDPGLECFGVAAPFSDTVFYSSLQYKNLFSTETPGCHFSTKDNSLLQLNLEMAYALILDQCYHLSFFPNNTFTKKVTDKHTGLKKIMEFEMISKFINVKFSGKLPEVDAANISKLFRHLAPGSALMDKLPLHLFSFEGITLIRSRDVTARESVNTIKNLLLSTPYFGDITTFEHVQDQVRMLTGIAGLNISITSVVEKNNDHNDLMIYGQDVFLSQPINFIKEDSPVWMEIKEVFEKRSSLVVPGFSDSLFRLYPFLQPLENSGTGSVLIFALKAGRFIIGVFSILINNSEQVSQQLLQNVEPIIPLLVMALGKQSEKIDDEIDKVVKEQFTAVQSSVNWKFTKAARNFILQKNSGQDSKIESIVFENVFPLYGSVDIRNSSVERSAAIQKDLLDQLQLAEAVIKKSKREIYLFSLQEIGHRIEKYKNIASVVLFPVDEIAIQNFLDEEIAGLFNHLKMSVPAIRNDIENYFLSLNNSTRKISKRCNAFEESIAMINNELVEFIIQEQIKIQQVYAHYFEYFVTDGVDFNIYIGQSITPDKPFDNFYLKNLKLWQLKTLIRAAQRVRKLHGTIPVALDTTQLILAHNKPLSISFRAAERKFDVDGAYNIHYEIIKKRIDKIKIMGSCERLTQPGKIAVVFAHDKEGREYSAYLEFLQKEGLLDGSIEYYDLEELPGVRGLKALRVSINMNDKEEEACPSMISEYQLPGAAIKMRV